MICAASDGSQKIPRRDITKDRTRCVTCIFLFLSFFAPFFAYGHDMIDGGGLAPGVDRNARPEHRGFRALLKRQIAVLGGLESATHTTRHAVGETVAYI